MVNSDIIRDLQLPYSPSLSSYLPVSHFLCSVTLSRCAFPSLPSIRLPLSHHSSIPSHFQPSPILTRIPSFPIYLFPIFRSFALSSFVLSPLHHLPIPFHQFSSFPSPTSSHFQPSQCPIIFSFHPFLLASIFQSPFHLHSILLLLISLLLLTHENHSIRSRTTIRIQN